MGLFKRKKDKVSDAFEQTPQRDIDKAWAEMEALVTEQDAALEKPKGDDTISEPNSVAEEMKRYEDMDLSAELGDAPTLDATPGAIKVDVDTLISDEGSTTPSREAVTKSVGAKETKDDFQFSVPHLATRDGRADLGTMRLDVARIAADIQSGEELYRRAQKRIENLTGFVEKAELDFSLLNRLEPENRRLKARNRTLESEIDDAKRKLEVTRSDLEDHRKRLAERSAVLEQLQSKMSLAQKSLQEYERVLDQTRKASDKHALTAERTQTSLDVERRENQVLRDKVTDLTAQMEERHTQTLEAQKMTDSLRQDAVDFRAQAEELSTDNIELRNALDHAQRANNQMKGEMISLHEDIRNFKTQSEFHVIAREDEMTALRAQVDELAKQLEIKDEIVRNAARDVQELRKIRTAQDLERERLESIIETQNFQLEEAGSRLIEAQQNVTDFDRRYRDVAAALNQQQALRESSPPAAAPDIMPGTHTGPLHDDFPMAPPLEAPAQGVAPSEDSPVTSNFELMDDEEIADRITDFALGLRNDIT
jgi:chromosome segregation ATPase